jgi:replicative DNA helicase
VLSNQVTDLARSVGAVCSWRTRSARTYRTSTGATRPCKESYVCTISYGTPQELFTLERKRTRARPNRRRANLTIRSVTPARRTETRCITVDRADGLYITDDFIVTHNSALAMNVAQHVASFGETVGFFSLEMSEHELGVRTLTAAAGVDGHRLQRGYIRESEWGRLSHAIGALAELPLYIDESPFITAFEMRSRARRLKAEHGLALLVVDYTQLMLAQESDRRENRTLELAAITRALKGLAKDLKIPVIALSQLSRRVEERQDKRPMLSDLRESGSLEQDADVVLFIYREAVYKETDENRRRAELIIGKQRNGPIGTIRLGWIPEETKFVNYAEVAEPEESRLPLSR